MPDKNVKYSPVANIKKKRRFFFIGFGSLCFLLLLISLILIITGYTLTKSWVYKERFIVVIDAGSTSSKISVFAYNDYPWREQGYVTEKYRIKIKPGISDYVNEPKMAFKNMEKQLKDLIGNNSKITEDTPLYLAATAGIRLTQIENPEKTDQLIKTLRDDLTKYSGLKVENSTRDIKILSGMEEGIYAWITANYLNKHFGTKPINLVKDPKDSAGVLDLGGASTQITFAIPDSEYEELSKDYIYSNPNIHKMKLYGKNFNLYSRSLLCLGKDRLQNHVHGSYIHEKIIQGTDGEKTSLETTMNFNDPCLIKGFSQEYEPNDFEVSPCDDLLGVDLKQIFDRTKGIVKKFNLIGTGNYGECLARIKSLLGSNGPAISGCDKEFCTIGGDKQPRPKRGYYAFAGFYYVFDFLLGKKKENEIKMSKTDFNKRINDLCLKKDAAVQLEANEEVSREIKNFCFDGVYIEYLLQSYGFDDDESWSRIRFINKIDETVVSWALGYAIVTSGFIPFDRPNLFIPYNLFMPLIITFCVFIILLLVLISCLKFRKRQQKQKDEIDMEENV